MAKRTNYSSWIYALVALGLAVLVAYLVGKNGNPFSSSQKGTRPRSRGKVQPKASAAAEKGVSAESLRSAIKRGDKFAVGVMSDGCGHCTQFKPDFFKAKGRLGGSLKYFDATNSRDGKLFDKLGVRGFPSIKFVNGGRAVGEYKGNRKADDVVKQVSKFMDS